MTWLMIHSDNECESAKQSFMWRVKNTLTYSTIYIVLIYFVKYLRSAAVGNFTYFKLCEISIYAVRANVCCTSSVTCTFVNKIFPILYSLGIMKKKSVDYKLRLLNFTC